MMRLDATRANREDRLDAYMDIDLQFASDLPGGSFATHDAPAWRHMLASFVPSPTVQGAVQPCR
jgi:hypothetical protein